MRKLRWVLLSAFLLAGVAVAAPPPYTVGDLTVRLATLLDLESDSVESARLALAEQGIDIRGGLDSPLLEGDAVEVLNQLGLQLTTSTPEEALSGEKVDLIFASLLSEERVGPAGAIGFENASCDAECRRHLERWCPDHPTAVRCLKFASRSGSD